MAKLFAFITFFIATNSMGQIPKVTIADTILLKAVNAFIDSASNMKLNYPTVPLCRINRLDVQDNYVLKPDSSVDILFKPKQVSNYELTIELHRDYPAFEWSTPAFVIDHRKWLIYVSFETGTMLRFDKRYKDRIMKKIKSSLKTRTPGNSLVALMRIKIKDDELTIGPMHRLVK